MKIELTEDLKSLEKVTRLEIIDETGRAYVVNKAKLELSLQDDGKTLKIFVTK